MKLHELRPAAGARRARTRAGRGIAAGKGKTAGRGTKGQNSRAGGGLPAWSEGGQTPLHIRVPKLRGFKRRFRVEYEVVNVGLIAQFAEQGKFSAHDAEARAGGPGQRGADAPLTVNAETLRAAGLIGNARRPLKVLGGGDVSRKLFVIADAFTKSAQEKIRAAGGTAQLLQLPEAPAPQPKSKRQGKQTSREDASAGSDAERESAEENAEPET